MKMVYKKFSFMRNWLRRVSTSIISIALPYFAVELFIAFTFLNIINNIDNIPALLPLNIKITNVW